jgi:hypothetical protein
MANSVHKDKQGPDWPLGSIVVTAPGTPVSIMSLVDPGSVNAPESPTPGTVGADEYTAVAQQIVIGGFKAGAGPPKLASNVGNVYLVRKPLAGAGGSGDVGTIVLTVPPGTTAVLGSAALVRNVFNLYRYFIDADNANDAAQVTALIF